MPESDTAVELPPERASELMRDGAAQLVDVRTPKEHDAAHIAGDELIPFNELRDRVSTLDQERPLVLYCRSGDRSGAAVQALRASGWDAYSVEGGLVSWHEQGLPIEPADGEILEPSSLPPA
jgi:rhodanese-related sulfurtransferase